MPVPNRAASAGFSALELLLVVAITGCVAAISLPASMGMVEEFSVSGDAHGVSNSIALARMNAAANFTRARLYVDRLAGSYHIDRWNKATSTWVAVGGTQPLGTGNSFATGGVNTPPPNSQAAIAQPPACLSAASVGIANTSCVIFNSRGLPVDTTGAPTTVAVIYVTGPTAVYGVVISSTSQLAMWRTQPAGTTWLQK